MLGDGAFTGTQVGIRGEVRRVEVSKKPPLTVTVECGFTIFDETGGRASMGASARVVDEKNEGKAAVAKAAADQCARNLEADLKAAVARTTR
jgi:hypothetical protein